MVVGSDEVLSRSAWIRSLGLAASGGVCIALTGSPLEWAILGWLGPAALLGAVEPAPGRVWSAGRALCLGIVFGTVVNAIALYWIVGLLQRFAGFPLLVAVPTAALLWVAQGVSFGLAAAGCSALVRARSLPGWIALAAALVVTGSLAPALFPWRLAATQIGFVPWIQLAELGGEPLLDALLGIGSCAAAVAARDRRWLPACVFSMALVLPFAYGVWRLPVVEAERRAAPILRVGVVQPSVSIEEKYDLLRSASRLSTLHAMSADLEARGAELVVWPETAYPYPWRRERARDVRGRRALLGPTVRGPLLAGAITVDAAGRRYNSAVAVEADGRIAGIADKVRLLAFGEYVPLWDWIPALQRRFARGLSPGHGPQVVTVAGRRLGVLNCYEDILPAVARETMRARPELLVNLTNDAWFGRSTEPHLHQALARLRAVETRRDLIRAVNTGVSSWTAATGRDERRTPTWTRASFVADARMLQGTTPWVRFGDLVTPALAALLLAAPLTATRRA
ncbi:MAG: apolipoprotein N-acyltransferase [Myxococcota bacterium]|nr:apolipoprotein N-acyltransferase [Myxococcota bacterium]MDW8364002.1 apolipoprotein N-acyltransferase [Myxococcales bacterium]